MTKKSLLAVTDEDFLRMHFTQKITIVVLVDHVDHVVHVDHVDHVAHVAHVVLRLLLLLHGESERSCWCLERCLCSCRR